MSSKPAVAGPGKRAGRRTGEMTFKVGEKGGVSVYGLGRFPVTLYYEQWIKLTWMPPANFASFWREMRAN